MHMLVIVRYWRWKRSSCKWNLKL